MVVLLARGRWAARLASPDLTGLERPPVANPLGLVQQAFSDLREALGFAADGGYRIYEAYIRIALAWARSMSQEMGYNWGQVDATEVLATIS